MAAVETTAPKAKSAGLPAHELVYRQLRELVLFGELAPGQAVTIQGLADRLQAGMMPVREGIRRLTAEGALASQGNRRVQVPALGPGNISELIFARASIEPQLMLRAAQNADDAAIEALVAEDALLDAAIGAGDVGGYLRHNFRFHEMVYDMADAPILRDIALGMWLRFGPSLRVVCGRLGTSNLTDQHKEALSAMRAGDAESAARAIREDVIQGMEQIRQSLAASAGEG